MTVRLNLSKPRILILAILLSFVWNAFWFSAVKVVVRPSQKEPVKFPQASFLGLPLGKAAMEVRAEPRTPSFLEERYLKMAKSARGHEGLAVMPPYFKEGLGLSEQATGENRLTYFIDEAISGLKSEPAYPAE